MRMGAEYKFESWFQLIRTNVTGRYNSYPDFVDAIAILTYLTTGDQTYSVGELI